MATICKLCKEEKSDGNWFTKSMSAQTYDSRRIYIPMNFLICESCQEEHRLWMKMHDVHSMPELKIIYHPIMEEIEDDS